MKITITHQEYEDNKEFTVKFLTALGQNELAEQCQQMTVFDEMGVYETKMSSVNVDENGITIDYNPVASKAFFDYIIQRITFVSMIIGMIVTPLVALFSALKYVKNVPGMKSFVAGLVDYVDEAIKKDTAAKARTVVKEEKDDVDLVSALEKIRTVCPDGGNWYDVVRPYKTNGANSPDKCRLLWYSYNNASKEINMIVDIYNNENGLIFDFFPPNTPLTRDIPASIPYSYVARNFSMAGLDVNAQAWIINKMFDDVFWVNMHDVFVDTTKTTQAWDMIHDRFVAAVSEYKTTQAIQQWSVDYNKKTNDLMSMVRAGNTGWKYSAGRAYLDEDARNVVVLRIMRGHEEESIIVFDLYYTMEGLNVVCRIEGDAVTHEIVSIDKRIDDWMLVNAVFSNEHFWYDVFVEFKNENHSFAPAFIQNAFDTQAQLLLSEQQPA